MPPFEVQPLALYSCSLELGKVTSENSRLCLQADMSPVVILLIVQQPTASDTPWWSPNQIGKLLGKCRVNVTGVMHTDSLVRRHQAWRAAFLGLCVLSRMHGVLQQCLPGHRVLSFPLSRLRPWCPGAPSQICSIPQPFTHTGPV
jgi:hypothetical protein